MLLLASTAGYLAFQCTIRFLVYPQFRRVPPDDFAGYEREHQRRVSLVVGPLFVVLVVSCAVSLVTGPWAPALLVSVAVLGVLVLTATLASPLHGRLSDGYDAALVARLLRVDSARLVCAVVAFGASAWFAFTS